MKPTTKRIIVIFSLIVGSLISIGTILILVGAFFYKSATPEKRIAASVLLTNQTAPVMIDSITRFDSVAFLPKDTLLYNFSLVNIEKGAIDTTNFRSIMHPEMVKEIKKDEKFKFYRENNITIVYRYRYEDGELIGDVVTTRDHYKEKVLK